jgi:hypothetical protein
MAEQLPAKLGDYANQLEVNEKKRYIDKISCIGIDPFIIPENNFDPECLPPVESMDLVSYLVLETSYYTQQQFKAFRSLQAYNQMVSGFIQTVQGQIISGKHVVIGKIRHSQRMNDPCVPVWIITESDGTISSAHCRGCMAGKGECCSHIASIMFYIETYNRYKEKVSCTGKPCEWILPSFKKDISYCEVENIDFRSASNLKQKLDESIATLDTACNKETPEPTKQTAKQEIAAPSLDEMKEFYAKLNTFRTKPVVLSLIPEY